MIEIKVQRGCGGLVVPSILAFAAFLMKRDAHGKTR